MSLDTIISALGKRNRDIRAAALFDLEGLPVASSLQEEMDSEEISAIAAALLSQGEALVRELGQGELNQAIFRAADGLTILSRCGEDLVFALLASPSARLGLLLMDSSRAVKSIQTELG